ncbi:uncharacterized protein YdhG (YjbR/CyaY superfamily) [Catalinimonas alkaloidigena]|uniref:iron chaperone n=1 Tax=Catalinimonas alkaloidigena TaxID=1075417 RepID=UPI0024056C6B|nr:DUF1801 domain-containing protein [Catalinimonas alkaloidigena]MDF9798617.1 uncharacterized protein YdhG (YjbR/CyaY superfamily) [Catalinimonas alkaloidigena]
MKSEKTKPETIDEYIADFPQDIQEVLEKVRATIHKAAPEAEEAISYQIPTFKMNGKNLVHFSAYKNHIGFYPGASGIEAFKRKLVEYKFAKGSVQFPLGRALPYELISEIVRYRVKENQEKAEAKAKTKKK